MRSGNLLTPLMGDRRRHLLDFSLGSGISFAVIAYIIGVLGTREVGCLAVLGVYCNRYPEGFLLNLLLHVPSDSPWALPLILLWWVLLSVPQGLLVMALHDAWRYRSRRRERPTPS